MAPIREIRQRKNRISNILQITKAMELVAAVKLQKAKTCVEQSRPYFTHLHEAVSSIVSLTKESDCRYLTAPAPGRKAVVALTSNRGLAGGYSSDVVRKIAEKNWKKEEVELYTIGKKGRENLEKRGYEICRDYSEAVQISKEEQIKALTHLLLQRFAGGEVSEIYVAYTSFQNTLAQKPQLIRLLPLNMPVTQAEKNEVRTPMNYEPKEEDVLEALIPQYISGMIYHAAAQAEASEHAARRKAMGAASENAREMADQLSAEYSKVRQNSITQELTEMIRGDAE